MGKPQVSNVIPAKSYTEEYLLTLVTRLEVGSDHPLGKAIVQYSLKKGIKLLEVDNFETIPGLGVKGKIKDRFIIAGNSRFLEQKTGSVSTVD